MRTLSVDLETFSSTNLAKSGVYRYAQSEDFEILLFGYSVDSGPVHVVDLVSGEQIPHEILSALVDSSVIKWGHNVSFERVCLSRYLGLPAGEYLDPSSWRCTMVWAATLGLPLSLEGVGAVLGLDKQKLKEGRDLIRYFCIPCKLREGTSIRHYPKDDSEKWERFKAYNIRDVETEMAIQKKLARYPVPDGEWLHYQLDQQINDRGILLDMPLVRNAIRCDSQYRQEHMDLAKEVTGLENPNSTAQMKAWLSEQGMEADSLSKASVLEMLARAEGAVEVALSLRQELAKSSVKKYTAMENAVCWDDRARGLFQFYGASRTGRWGGRLLQPQNLPATHMSSLDAARQLIRKGDFQAAEMLFDSVPIVLSELIRTAFIPKPGNRFFVADFSAIEARVIAWLAGEEWRLDVFDQGGDIYCASASQMFHVPVEKNGVNRHLRQKGKVAELACIAEDSLVLTDKGLVPIQCVERDMLLWDGFEWVRHEGVVFKGKKEIIEYEGLRATPDHLVWVEGKTEPIRFGYAATYGAHLVQTGDGRKPIRMGENHQPRKALESEMESLLCPYRVHRVWKHPMAELSKHSEWKIKRMSKLFAEKGGSTLVAETPVSGKMSLRESKRQRLCKIRRSRHPFQLFFCAASWNMGYKELSKCEERARTRPHRYQWKLRAWQSEICSQETQSGQPSANGHPLLQSSRMAIWSYGRNANAQYGYDQGGHPNCSRGSSGKAKEELAHNISKARLYDIRNAGSRNRYTVSGKLVHNCGYGGSVGALKAMGALEMGLQEHELSGLIHQWRSANPNIVQFWWDVDRAVKACIAEKSHAETHGIRFQYQSGFLFITLPSGRRLAYVKPRIGENRFGGESVTYEGVGSTKKWDRIESYGPKFVENIVQATARDILADAMSRLDSAGCRIVMHVHDEAVIEAPGTTSLEEICVIMGQTPAWAKGLLLRADGFVCDYYKKE